MKKVVSSAGTFGPFSVVERLDDRLRCDGADLPFTVIGVDASVQDAQPDDFPAPLRQAAPSSITPRQARLALLGAGLLSSVDVALAGLPEPQKSAAQIEWEYATSVERSSPLVTSLGGALGLTGAQIDALFIQAAAL